MAELGAILQQHRKKKGFSQSDIAKYLNLSQKDMSQIESDILVPTFRQLNIMCRKYSISLMTIAREMLAEPSLSDNKRLFLIRFFESLT